MNMIGATTAPDKAQEGGKIPLPRVPSRVPNKRRETAAPEAGEYVSQPSLSKFSFHRRRASCQCGRCPPKSMECGMEAGSTGLELG